MLFYRNFVLARNQKFINHEMLQISFSDFGLLCLNLSNLLKNNID